MSGTSESSQVGGVLDVAALAPVAALDEIDQVFHVAADSICGREPADTLVSSEAFGSLKALIIAAVGGNWDDDKTSSALATAGLSAHAASFKVAVSARGGEIRSALVARAPLLFPLSLKDVDWSVRMTMSSDAITALRRPTALITLSLAPVAGSTGLHGAAGAVTLELSGEELDALIASLSKANDIVQAHTAPCSMGNLCSDARTDSHTPWSAVHAAVLQGAAHCVVAAVNFTKESPFVPGNGSSSSSDQSGTKVSSSASSSSGTNCPPSPSPPPSPLLSASGEPLYSPSRELSQGSRPASMEMQLDDTVIPMHLHHEAWQEAVEDKLAELIAYVDGYTVWPRVQAFRAAKLAISAQAKVTRLIAPALVGHFAQATKQPPGFAQHTLNLISPIIAAHYTRFLREAGARSRGAFEEIDRHDRNYISLDDLQALFLPRVLSAPAVIVKGRKLSISMHDDAEAAEEAAAAAAAAFADTAAAAAAAAASAEAAAAAATATTKAGGDRQNGAAPVCGESDEERLTFLLSEQIEDESALPMQAIEVTSLGAAADAAAVAAADAAKAAKATAEAAACAVATAASSAADATKASAAAAAHSVTETASEAAAAAKEVADSAVDASTEKAAAAKAAASAAVHTVAENTAEAAAAAKAGAVEAAHSAAEAAISAKGASLAAVAAAAEAASSAGHTAVETASEAAHAAAKTASEAVEAVEAAAEAAAHSAAAVAASVLSSATEKDEGKGTSTPESKGVVSGVDVITVPENASEAVAGAGEDETKGDMPVVESI